MGDITRIGWCDHTFNGWIGCSPVSAGCRFCYANKQSQRWRPGNDEWRRNGTRRLTSERTWRAPEKWNREAEREGREHLVFASSLADVFEDRRDLDAPRDRIFEELVPATPWLNWLFLSKRISVRNPGLIGELTPWEEAWPDNVWLGASVESQRYAIERIDEMERYRAKVRFLSCEPLIGAVDLSPWLARGVIHWVVIGGESGPERRPMELAWLVAIVDQCRDAGVSVFVKQDSAYRSGQRGRIPDEYWLHEFPATAKVA